MNIKEATKRIGLRYSHLANVFYAGLLNKNGDMLLEQIDVSSDFFGAVMKATEKGNIAVTFKGDDKEEEYYLTVLSKRELEILRRA
jgi:hypothetical protein